MSLTAKELDFCCWAAPQKRSSMATKYDEFTKVHYKNADCGLIALSTGASVHPISQLVSIKTGVLKVQQQKVRV
jgi:hypothetical protein